MKKISLTIIFLTLNEEFHIAEALDNVKDIAEEIFIVDSLSSDNTVSIALEKGAKVIQRPFTNFGDQWNFALDKLPIKTKWTMKMDPDERLTQKLKDEIVEKLSSEKEYFAFSYPFQLYFMGKPLQHYLKGLVRIWKTNECHFSKVGVNEHLVVNGNITYLKNKAQHLDSANLSLWVAKQNRYTTTEAIRRFRGEALAAKPKIFGNALERHMFLKKIFFKLPFRYFLMFLHLYFIKGLWLSGSTGLHCVFQRMWSRKLIEAKLQEMKNMNKELTIPVSKNISYYDKRVLESPLQKEIFRVQKNEK